MGTGRGMGWREEGGLLVLSLSSLKDYFIVEEVVEKVVSEIPH